MDQKYRFAFVMDQQVGLRTQALNFERVVGLHPEIDPVWVPVSYTDDSHPLARMPGLPESIKGTLRGVHEIRHGFGSARYDGTLWATWAAKSVLDLVSAAPAFLVMDMTPTQMEAMGDLYGYTQRRARFLGGMKRRRTIELYRQATHLFPWNRWVAESLQNEYEVPAEKITPVSPGVDVDLYCPRADVKQNDGVVRLLFVGGDFIRKGGDLLLRWARETKVTAKWELHIATRDEVPPTPNVVVHKNLKNNSPELIRLYQQSDLFVLPTRADCYSLVAMEAMATGMPVIISRLGGIPEIVLEGETGHLIDVGDEATLFRHLDHLVMHPEVRRQMGEAARHRALQNFDCRANLTRILETMKNASPREASPAASLAG